MKVNELQQFLNLESLNEADMNREITGGYAGDLLSWVMGRAQSGNVWVTIMTNQNILAVASLADVSCIIIAENSEIAPSLVESAREQEITLFRSPETTFSLCTEIGNLLR